MRRVGLRPGSIGQPAALRAAFVLSGVRHRLFQNIDDTKIRVDVASNSEVGLPLGPCRGAGLGSEHPEEIRDRVFHIGDIGWP